MTFSLGKLQRIKKPGRKEYLYDYRWPLIISIHWHWKIFALIAGRVRPLCSIGLSGSLFSVLESMDCNRASSDQLAERPGVTAEVSKIRKNHGSGPSDTNSSPRPAITP